MDRRPPPGTLAVLTVLAALVAGRARGQDGPNPRAFAREGSPSQRSEGPIYLFQEGPLDREALRQRLASPDFVVLRGEDYARLRAAASAGEGRQDAPAAAVVEAVVLSGEVRPDLARLTLTARVHLREGGPTRVPLGLAGAVVERAAEGGEDRPVHAAAAGGWEVELAGAGGHQIGVELLVPVRQGGDERVLELPIPTAGSTRLDLELPADTREVRAGSGPAWPAGPAEPGGPVRLRMSLLPRGRLVLHMFSDRAAEEAGPPLLTAQGEIVATVERGSLRLRSSWAIRCERGTARAVEIELPDPEMEVESLEIEDVTVPPSAIDPARRVLAIAPPAPLRRGETLRVGLALKRPLGLGSEAVRLRGLPIVGAAGQAGIVAVVQGPDLWVGGRPGAGVRAIDPRKELPDALRARPAIALAYQFIDQPFELDLRVDPAAQPVRAEGRQTIRVERGAARLAAELDFHAAKGRPAEVRIGLGADQELESIGPAGVVEAHRVVAAGGGRSEVVARLASRGGADGSYRVQVAARQPLPSRGTMSVGLIRALGVDWRGGRVGVVPARDVGVELAEGEMPPGLSAAATDEPAAAGENPGEGDGRSLQFRADGRVEALPLEILAREREVEQSSRVSYRIGSGRLEARQHTEIRVRGGTLARIDLAVPPALEGAWEIEGDGVVSRDRLGRTSDGGWRYRLHLAREVIDSIELRFRFRADLPAGAVAEGARTVELTWLRPLGMDGPVERAVGAEDGFELEPRGEGWSAGRPVPTTTPEPAPARWVWAGQAGAGEAPMLLVRPPRLAELPGLWISRLWLRTSELPEGDRRGSCWLRVERHPGWIPVRLPPGSRWLEARAGAIRLAVEEGGPGEAARVLVPPEAVTPLTVRLEWRGAGWGRGEAAGPELDEGTVVEESLWEARVLGSRALAGVPDGWSDLNRWFFDRYVWKRRPRLGPAELAAWVGLNPQREAPAGTVETDHGYLFGRQGAPLGAGARIWPRAVLVAIGSGGVLLLGLGVLLLRPTGRVAALAALGAAWAACIGVEPNLGLLALQASAPGAVLVLLAGAVQWRVDRWRRRSAPAAETALGSGLGGWASGSGLRPASEVGSEESTVVRRRASTTLDFVPGAALDEAPGVGVEPGGSEVSRP